MGLLRGHRVDRSKLFSANSCSLPMGRTSRGEGGQRTIQKRECVHRSHSISTCSAESPPRVFGIEGAAGPSGVGEVGYGGQAQPRLNASSPLGRRR